MSAYGRFFGLYDRMFQTYSHYGDGSALIRSWDNDGDYISGSVGMAFSLKLLNGNLQFYANPEMSFNKITGSCPLSYNPFNCSVNVTYYLNQWYFQGIYETSQKGLRFNANTIYRTPDYYGLTAGWSNADWNIRLSVYNFFNKGWKSSTSECRTPLYSEFRTDYGNDYHSYINLSVTYTFGYGKKVERGNEVGEQSKAASAIMK